jgi:valine dehydrogenase (NAD+)
VGTDVPDMDIIARECRFVTGRSEVDGGAGDSSVLTAYGVFQGMRACAAHTWGTPTLSGRRVGVAGVGKVGSQLVGHLLADGASVVVTDVNAQVLDVLRLRHPDVEVAASTTALLGAHLDVYAPCALGGALDKNTVAQLSATVVCGGANNQLAHPEISQLLRERGILYAPDYVVNAGGVIQVADEIAGFRFERAKARAAGIYSTTTRVLAAAAQEGLAPEVAADRLAEQRMAAVGRLRAIAVRE